MTDPDAIDTPAAFLRCVADTPASKVAVLALDVTERWFERPHDATIWACMLHLAKHGTDPRIQIVNAALLDNGQYSREVKARMLTIASDPFNAVPGQLGALHRALAAEAWHRRFRDGAQAMLDDAPTMSRDEGMRRAIEWGTELRRLDNAANGQPGQKLKVVPA